MFEAIKSIFKKLKNSILNDNKTDTKNLLKELTSEIEKAEFSPQEISIIYVKYETIRRLVKGSKLATSLDLNLNLDLAGIIMKKMNKLLCLKHQPIGEQNNKSHVDNNAIQTSTVTIADSNHTTEQQSNRATEENIFFRSHTKISHQLFKKTKQIYFFKNLGIFGIPLASNAENLACPHEYTQDRIGLSFFKGIFSSTKINDDVPCIFFFLNKSFNDDEEYFEELFKKIKKLFSDSTISILPEAFKIETCSGQSSRQKYASYLLHVKRTPENFLQSKIDAGILNHWNDHEEIITNDFSKNDNDATIKSKKRKNISITTTTTTTTTNNSSKNETESTPGIATQATEEANTNGHKKRKLTDDDKSKQTSGDYSPTFFSTSEKQSDNKEKPTTDDQNLDLDILSVQKAIAMLKKSK